MGTPSFACPSLEALIAGPDPVVAVVSQPDRPRGRGLEVVPTETKRLAERHGIPVLQPERVRDAVFHEALRALAPDLGVVAAYGRILPRSLLDLPVHGCINVHASLLPRHRGAARPTARRRSMSGRRHWAFRFTPRRRCATRTSRPNSRR